MFRRMSIVPAMILLVLIPALPAQDKEKKPVNLKILLPRDDAALTIDGKATDRTGKTREFVSPAVEVGPGFTYTLKATITPNNYTTIVRTRKVKVTGGGSYEVDMTQNDPKSPDDITIRFVPTPPEIVEAMLKLAKVGKDDVVYDLGCGDGRMVIAAVKKAGAKRGVGIDLDPERVKESKEAVKAEGVGDKVEIREGDVLKVKDISDASVIMLYMGNELNEALRPILQKQLKPGSRIVSHRFIMGDWKPEKSEALTGADGSKYEIHLWIVGK
jgi:uncharacterized protein (TIGR03000 family)